MHPASEQVAAVFGPGQPGGLVWLGLDHRGHVDPPDRAAVEQEPGRDGIAPEAVVVPDHQHDARALARRDHLPALRDGERHRFFDQHVFSSSRRT